MRYLSVLIHSCVDYKLHRGSVQVALYCTAFIILYVAEARLLCFLSLLCIEDFSVLYSSVLKQLSALIDGGCMP